MFFEHKEIQTLFKLLDGTGSAKPCLMIVGGAVRDFLLGLPIKDIDMATTHTPQAVIKILSKRFKVIPTGIDHGTVSVLTSLGSIQITTLRTDTDTDGRRARVDYTEDWLADALRRDFTINTLLMDRVGDIYDPLAVGVGDLAARRVRFVGDVALRVREDYLRILRYVRFYARFARGKMVPSYLSVFKAVRSDFKTISVERVTEELRNIIVLKNGFTALRQFQDTKILSYFKIEDHQVRCHKKLYDYMTLDDVKAFALLANLKKSNWQRIKSNLRLPNHFVSRVDGIIDGMRTSIAYDELSFERLQYRYGRMIARDIVWINLARDGISSVRAERMIEIFDSVDAPVFPVKGRDLIKAGFDAGPDLGARLKKLEQAWVKSGFKLLASELIKLA